MADLSPSQLDELEDGLGELVATTDVAALGLSDEVAEQMEVYRGVLELVGSHLDEEELSTGVLDDVLAKAHAEVAATAGRDGAAKPTRAGGRRRWWMPALALAGVSAAVLLIVEPEQAMEGAAPAEFAAAEVPSVSAPALDELEEALARAPASAPALQEPEDPEAPLGEQARGDLTAADAKADEGTKEGLAGLDADTTSESKRARRSTKARETKGGSYAKGGGSAEAEDDARGYGKAEADAPLSAQRPPSKKKASKASAPKTLEGLDGLAGEKSPFGDTADPKRDWGETLSNAHKLRRGGRCNAALREYQTLARHDEVGDALLGEVYGGMGLCAEVSGDLSKAKIHFERARGLKPGLDAWLTTERGRMSSK